MMRRLLRCLRFAQLPCGCSVGIYETYAGETLAILDDQGEGCALASHVAGRTVGPADSDALRLKPGCEPRPEYST